jgi:serine/threonine protein kinase
MIRKVSAAKGYVTDDPDEQCTALKGYGKEADVWSLGCVAAELLTAKNRCEVCSVPSFSIADLLLTKTPSASL